MTSKTNTAAMFLCAAVLLSAVSACDIHKSTPTQPEPIFNPAPASKVGSDEPGDSAEPPAPAAIRAADPDSNVTCWDTAGHHRDHCIPLPEMYAVVARVAAEHPNALRSSCQDHGGSWEFMDLVVDELRQQDTRWGYNGKRGDVNNPSHDAIAYHFGGGPDQNSPDVHVVDIIGGHCGPDPGPAWINVTNFHGAGAAWTSRGRF